MKLNRFLSILSGCYPRINPLGLFWQWECGEYYDINAAAHCGDNMNICPRQPETVHSGRYIYYKLTKTNLTRSVHGSARIYRQVTSLVRNFIWYIKLFILIQFVRRLIWSWFTIQMEWSEGMVSQQSAGKGVKFRGNFNNIWRRRLHKSFGFVKASQTQVERL